MEHSAVVNDILLIGNHYSDTLPHMKWNQILPGSQNPAKMDGSMIHLRLSLPLSLMYASAAKVTQTILITTA